MYRPFAISHPLTICSSLTFAPVAALTNAFVFRSSSWLNDTLCLGTAWKSFTGIAINPNETVPLHTGLAIVPALHSSPSYRQSLMAEHRPAKRPKPLTVGSQKSALVDWLGRVSPISVRLNLTAGAVIASEAPMQRESMQVITDVVGDTTSSGLIDLVSRVEALESSGAIP